VAAVRDGPGDVEHDRVREVLEAVLSLLADALEERDRRVDQQVLGTVLVDVAGVAASEAARPPERVGGAEPPQRQDLGQARRAAPAVDGGVDQRLELAPLLAVVELLVVGPAPGLESADALYHAAGPARTAVERLARDRRRRQPVLGRRRPGRRRLVVLLRLRTADRRVVAH